jgi:hypothetical protein
VACHDRDRGEYGSKLLGAPASGQNLAGGEVHLVDGRRASLDLVLFRHANEVDQSSYLSSSEQGGPRPREPQLGASSFLIVGRSEGELNAASLRIVIANCDHDNIEPEQRVFAEELKHYDFEIIATTHSREEEEKLRDAFGQESLKYRQSANAHRRG